MPATPDTDIGLWVEADSPPGHARRLVSQYGLTLLRKPPPRGYYLRLSANGLELCPGVNTAHGPIRVDFTQGSMSHRLRFGGGRGQALARAVGIKPGYSPTLVDATAGLGRDGFVLASLGCKAQLIERSAVLAALLEDGLQRAFLNDELSAWVTDRITLVHSDAQHVLASCSEERRPDVVYLDPMYPAGKDHVLVKKEMRALQQILGPDQDSGQLLAAACRVARRRVVVKRPKRAAWLDDLKPHTCVESKKTRYDIYVTLASTQNV